MSHDIAAQLAERFGAEMRDAVANRWVWPRARRLGATFQHAPQSRGAKTEGVEELLSTGFREF
jgi:hypothetical protein